ncbi:molecular chaperone, partial [Mycolicibacterium peregrinum]|uniref:Hsp70 family protein n=1 Tax=Mycolicibacterium peregrinum TaxID=43304 RepID=UPI000B6ADA63
RQAKERLSAETATDLVVELPGYSATVRVTRTELEGLMQAPLAGVLDALEKALERNGISWPAVSAVVTIGGGASIPLVTQQLSQHSQAQVVTTPQPALDAAIGAALSAAYSADAEAQTGVAPTLGVAAVPPLAEMPTGAGGSEASSTFRALAWSEDDAGDDVVPYTGPDLVESYGSETAARPAVQYVAPTGPIEQPRGGWERLPLTVFAVAAALVLVAIGGVTYALTSATGTAPSSEVKPPEPKPLPPQEVAPSPVAPPPPAEPPPAPEPVT